MKYAVIPVFLIIMGCAATYDSLALRESDDPGAQLYSKKCMGCHQPVPPGKFTADELVARLERHRKRVTLTEDEKMQIIDFLQVRPDTT